MNKKEKDTNESKLIVALDLGFKSLLFDMIYDQFISSTDTKQLIENVSTENLESFLYQTAWFFYSYGKAERRKAK